MESAVVYSTPISVILCKIQFQQKHNQQLRHTRMTTNENNELEDVVNLDHEQQEELDEVRFGPTPVPTDFNRTEKPQAILSRSIIICLLTSCCIIPIAVIIFIVLLLVTIFFYSPYTANYSLMEQNSPHVLHGTLDNGLKYAILQNGIKSGKFSTFMQVNTGSTNEMNSERGIAHMVEHMAFDNSKQFPGRAGVWNQIENAGVGYFNAYTSFRNTVYMFFDVIVDAGDARASINKIMNIFYNQVQNMEVVDQYLQQEKGAVLGEARMRNSSIMIALESMLHNHGGNAWRIGTRFPIGTQPIIKSWSSSDVNAYYNKWYRLDKMILYFVGDVEPNIVKQTVADFWNSKSLKPGQSPEKVPNEAIGRPNPIDRFFMREVDGINGINFNMLITQPYIGHPRDMNYFRREFGDLLFTLIYGMQVISRFLMEYPGMDLSDFQLRNAGISTVNEYAFDSCLTAMSILTPGPSPNSGTWRKDLGIAVEELSGLAKDGPSVTIVTALTFVLPYLMEATPRDSTEIIYELLGDEDPDHYYTDANQRARMFSEFTGFGFGKPFAQHIQAQAQLVYNTLYNLTYGNEMTEKPYPYIIDVPEASMNIFVGRNDAPYNIPPISEKDIKDELRLIFNKNKPKSNFLSSLIGANSLGGLFGKGFSPLEPRPPKHAYLPKVISSDSRLRLKIFELRNGIRVNIKSNDPNSASPAGYSRMEIVSFGGKTSQLLGMKGACEFVNMVYPSGFRYYFEGREYFFDSALGSLTCESNFLTISIPLHNPCVQENSLLCDVTKFNYTDQIESALLWMNPVYENEDIDAAVAYMNEEARIIRTDNDPFTHLTKYVIPETIARAFPNDSRFQTVTAEDIAKLHPLAIQYWVSTQFRPDRIEINVVGDLDNTVLLEDLERWLGSLPHTPAGAIVKLGYDVYSESDAPYFNTTFPSNTVQNYACDLPNISPDRAFVASIYPADGYLDYPKAKLSEALLGAYFFDVIRSQYGFSYFASHALYHNYIMRDASFYIVVWQTGDYPPANSSDPLNIERSQDIASHAIRTSFPQSLFNNEKSAYLSSLDSALQIIDSWLSIIRGISIKVPVTWKSTTSDGPFLKSLKQLDIIGQIQNLQYSNMKDSLSSPVFKFNSEIRAQLTTVPPSDNQKLICRL
jgi:predicted Zn-dependent peptidase